MKKYFYAGFLVFFIFINIPSAHATLRVKKPFSCQKGAKQYFEKHYARGYYYYKQKNWKAAAEEFERIIYFFPCSSEAVQISYDLGICYFEMKEYDFANEQFSNYIKTAEQPEFFEEAVRYKFCIAELLKCGKKKRPFSFRYLPKWVSGQNLALTIYDEVVIALCNHEIAVQALYAKAELLTQMREFRLAVETYQSIIRKFPRHELIPLCYFNITDTYYQESCYDLQNPDILGLAELNVAKFEEEFPRNEYVEQARARIEAIKDLYAQSLYRLGLFYERTSHPEAAIIYYRSALEKFPDTRVGKCCQIRLANLGYEELCVDTKENLEDTVESQSE